MDRENIQLLIELKTVSICLIKDGVDAKQVVAGLYMTLEKEGIRYPKVGTKASDMLWDYSIKQATDSKCRELKRLYRSTNFIKNSY